MCPEIPCRHLPGRFFTIRNFLCGTMSNFSRISAYSIYRDNPSGYCAGQLDSSAYGPDRRTRILFTLGISAIVLFIVLRLNNLYGDPVKWSVQKNVFFTFLSFIKVIKYPPSLLYVLMTIGAAMLFLAFTERAQNSVAKVVSVYGRVPMFYYIIHTYVIHRIAEIATVLSPGQDWHIWLLKSRSCLPPT